jgi:hypothetical protein
MPKQKRKVPKKVKYGMQDWILSIGYDSWNGQLPFVTVTEKQIVVA